MTTDPGGERGEYAEPPRKLALEAPPDTGDRLPDVEGGAPDATPPSERGLTTAEQALNLAIVRLGDESPALVYTDDGYQTWLREVAASVNFPLRVQNDDLCAEVERLTRELDDAVRVIRHAVRQLPEGCAPRERALAFLRHIDGPSATDPSLAAHEEGASRPSPALRERSGSRPRTETAGQPDRTTPSRHDAPSSRRTDAGHR